MVWLREWMLVSFFAPSSMPHVSTYGGQSCLHSVWPTLPLALCQCVQSYSQTTHADAAHGDDGERAQNSGCSNDPGETQKENHAKDVLHAGQVNSDRSSHLGDLWVGKCTHRYCFTLGAIKRWRHQKLDAQCEASRWSDTMGNPRRVFYLPFRSNIIQGNQFHSISCKHHRLLTVFTVCTTLHKHVEIYTSIY